MGILQARVLELGAIAFSDIIHEGSSYQEASLVAQLVKSPPVMQETHVRFLGWEAPLEKGQATHSSIFGLPWWLSW